MSSLGRGDRNKPDEEKGSNTPEGSARGLEDWKEGRKAPFGQCGGGNVFLRLKSVMEMEVQKSRKTHRVRS